MEFLFNNKYTVTGKLGEGAPGTVYKAKDPVTGKDIAIKVFSKDRHSSSLREFKNEFSLIKSLNHPNIANVYDFGTTQKVSPEYFFTMDYIDGEDIVGFIQKANSKKDYNLLYDIIAQVCDALDYIHTKGLIHYDIKPTNILVTKSGAVKLLDFGFSEERTYKTNLKIKGTPLYVSPEIIKGLNADSRTDLYSLGCVLYEGFTGSPPFKGNDIISIFRNHLEVSPSMEKIPVNLHTIITKSMEKSPSERFQSTNDIISEINKITGKEFKIRAVDDKSPLISAKFTGREKEISFLKNIIKDIGAEGAFNFVLLGGETGCGKTRLLQELKCISQLKGINVFTNKCFDPSLPYHGISSALREMTYTSTPGALQDYAFYINKVLDEEVIKPDKKDDKKAQEGNKSVFFNKLAEFISQQSGIIIIEDLNYCDKTTLEFLEFLTEKLVGIPLTTIVSYSTDTLKSSPALNNTLSAIKGKKSSTELLLSPLSRKEIFSFAESIFGASFVKKHKSFLDKVYSSTRGNCFFIEEHLKTLIEKKLIRKKQNGWALDKNLLHLKTPETIKSLLSDRLNLIDEKDIKLLQYASVIGDSFNIYLLQTISGEKLESIYKLRMTELVREKGTGIYEFRNPELRQLLYDKIPVKTRVSIHSRIGKILEGEEEKDYYNLAYHFIKSKDKEKAFKYGIIFADNTRYKYANEEAIFMYKQLLPVVTLPIRRSEIFEGIAYINSNLGNHDESLKNYKKVIECNALKPEFLAEIHTYIAALYEEKGEYEKSLDALSKAEELAKKYKFDNSIIELKKSWSLILKGENEKAKLCLEKLEKTMDMEKDFDITVILYQRLSIAYRSFGNYQESEKAILKAIEWAKKGDIYSKVSCYDSAGNLFFEKGEYKKALKHFEISLKYCRKSDYKTAIGYPLKNIGTIYTFIGDYVKALKYLSEAIENATEIQDTRLLIIILIRLNTLYEHKGDSKKAFEYIQKCFEISKGQEEKLKSVTMFNLLSAGRYYNFTGNFSKSIKYLNKSILAVKETKEIESQIIYYAVLSELYGNFSCPDKALIFAQKALQIIEKHSTKKELPRVCNSVAKSFVLLGNYKEAKKHLFRAVKTAEEMGEIFYKYTALLMLTRVHLKEKDYDLARGVIKELSEIVLDSRHLNGEFLYLKGLLPGENRVECFLKAEELIKDTGAAELTRELYASIANFYEGSMEQSKSILYYKKSNEILTQMTDTIDNKEVKECFLNDKKELIEKMKKLESISSVEKLSQPHFVKLYEILQIVNSVMGLDEMLNKTMDIAIEILKAERGLIILVNKSTNSPEVKTARNMDRQTIRDATSISNSIIKGVSSRGEPVFTRNALTDPNFNCKRSVILHRIKSIMCVPLKTRNIIIGTIYIDTRNVSNLFSDEDIKFLTAFANQAALTIENARLREKLLEDVEYFKQKEEKKYRFTNIIGSSPGMQEVYKLIENVADVGSTVLIEGATGTGKEMVAGAIHYHGNRRGNKFIPVACGALPEHLLESELFGHKKGAFTGAIEDKKGLFEEADGGTLFLDDVVNLSPGIQAKLLRVLDSGEIRRVGDTKTIKVDTRILAASNLNIEDEVRKGNFREDLFYRLNVVTIKIPSLRDRKEDIPELANHFLKKYSKATSKKVKGFSKETMELLCSYDWPGNVRELEHEIEKIVVLIGDNEVIVTEKMLSTKGSHEKSPSGKIEHLEQALKEMESAYIRKALQANDGNKLKTAKQLGINRATLHKKLKKLKI